MKILFAAACAISLLVPAFAASAKSTDRNEPMSIDAGAQTGTLDGNGKTTLSQGVIVIQGTLDLRSSEAEIYLKDGEPVRAVFTGKQAKLKQQLDDGSWMDASADRIDYDIKGEVLTLTGNYNVKSARGTNAGQKMTYNTRTGEMNSGGDGTRVRTVIQPKAKTAAPAAAVAAGVPVTFSNAARALDANSRASTDFDANKVKAVRAAIEKGTFTVDADAIADKLLSNAQEIISHNSNSH